MGNGLKGSNTTQSFSAPNATAMGYYNNVLQQAAGAAATPYQPFQGQEVAPVNQQQLTGIGGINAAAGQAQPGIAAGFGQIQGSSQPLTAAQIQQYESPYTQQVVNATEAQFNNQNQQQQAGVVGNAAAQGALGGDRVGVAQALTAEQQNLTQAPVIAGLENTGYQQAVQTAEQQQQTGLAGGQAMVGAAQAGQTAGLQGANAQIGAGTLEQQTQQAQDTQAMQDYFQQQGYPFQVAQYMAGIATGVGSQMGGFSQTQGPTPSLLNQVGGLGVAGLGLYGLMAKRGGRIPDRAGGGRIPGFAAGGYTGPWGAKQTWVPGMTITHGSGPPKAPNAPSQQNASTAITGNALKGVADIWNNNSSSGDAKNDYAQDLATGDAGTGGFDAFVAAGEARGGRVRRYANGGFADGGDPDSFDDRFDAAFPNYSPPVAAGVGGSGPAVESRGLAPDDNVVPFPKPRPAEADSDVLSSDNPVRLTGQGTWGDTAPPPIKTSPGVQAINKAAPMPEDEEPQSGGPLGYAPSKTAGVGPAPDPIQQQTASWLDKMGIHLDKSERHALNTALLQAGFAMMASRAGGPNSFLQAVGQGGEAGVASYGKSMQQERENELEAAKLKEATEEKHLADARQPIIRGPNGAMMVNPAYKAQLAAEEDAKNYKPTYGVIRTEIDPNTGLERKIMGWIDPNTRKTTEAEGQGQPLPPINPNQPPPPPSPAAPPNGSKSGPGTPEAMADGVLNANAQLVGKGTYNYSQDAPYIEKGMDVPDPEPVAGHSTDSVRSQAEMFLQTGKLPPVRAGKSPVAVIQNQYRNAVENYGNALAKSRGMSPEDMATAWREAPGMLRFVLGADGRATVALGTAVRHLDTLKEYADLWNQKAFDTPAFRRVQAAIQRQWGENSASNMDTVAHIVGPEILKAIGIAGAGSKEEREKVSAQFSSAHSPQQLAGAIDATQRLMSGQLEGKERQASIAGVSHERFKKMIGDRPYEILSQVDKAAGSGVTGQDKQALDWAKANPNDPRAAKIKSRLGVQ